MKPTRAPVIPNHPPSHRRHLSLVPHPPFAQEHISSEDIHSLVRSGEDATDSFELIAVWQTWLRASYAPATAEGYHHAVMRFLTANPVPILMVEEAVIAAWIESFPYRSSRRVTYFHALRSLYGWLLRHGHIDKDPTAGIRVPTVEEKEPRALTIDQYEAVKAAAYRRSPIRGYAIELFYYSGGRLGETVRLKWSDVTYEGIIFTQTKGGRERTVPWSPGLKRAVEGLRSHFGEQDRVLPRAEQTVWLWMREAGKDAGVEGVHPHLFRATTATRAQQNGAKVTTVAKLLGHRKITTTQRYLAVEKEEIAAAVKLL
jgi:integrase